MTQPNTVVVRPSWVRLLVLLILSCLGMVGGVLVAFGWGTIPIVVASVITALLVLCYLFAVVRQRPRVVITAEGFVFQKVFGEDSHKWEEIEGPFAVIKIGLFQAVGYNFTAEYKSRGVKDRKHIFSGYDAAISGAFKMPAAQLAELLNTHLRRSRVTTPPGTAGR